jgi:hypothetical protein
MPLTSYPAALDTFPEILPNDREDAAGIEHDVMHNLAFEAIAAAHALLGTTTDAEPGTVLYVLEQLAVDAAALDDRVGDAETAIAGKADASHSHAASDISSGTFDDARIAASNVTQHQAALSIGWGQLSGSPPALLVTEVYTVASEAAQLALTAQEGDIAIRSDEAKTYAHNGGTAGTMADWSLLQSPTDAVVGLGTAAVQNIGTSGANVPLLSTANTWGSTQTFDRIRAATGSADNFIRWDSASSENHWLRFRRSGSPSAASGLVFSSFANNHFFVDNTNAQLNIRYSTEASETPAYSGASIVFQLTPTGINSTAIGVTTPSTIAGTTGTLASLVVNAGGTGWGIAGETVAELVRTTAASSGVNLQLTAGNTGRNTISFGDTDSATIGQIQYRHDTDDFVFRVGAGNRGFWRVQGLTIGADYVPASSLGGYGRFNSVTNSANTGDGIQIARYRNSSGLAADLEFLKSQSTTVGAHGALPGGSRLGAITWSGSDGAAFQQAAEIRVEANAAATSGVVRGRVIFSAANASGVMTEYMRSTDGSGLSVTGAITASTTITAAKSLLVSDVHALTAVSTSGQTRTLDLANGAVQTLQCSNDHNFTMNATGPAGVAGRLRLFVYNSGTVTVDMTLGTGWFSTYADGMKLGTSMLEYFWDGTRMWEAGETATGDQRPT